QPYVRGDEHRVFVLHGRALFSYRKHQPALIGDGRTTVRELIGAAGIFGNRKARDGAGAPVAQDAIPSPGARIMLEGPANRSAGGGSAGLMDGAPDALAAL